VCVCVCVCVCGDACRVGRSVVAGLVVRSGVGVDFSVKSSGGVARGVAIAAWCGILGVNDTTLLQVATHVVIVKLINTILRQLCFDGPTHPHLHKTQRG
jgi:hypothetical protein